MFDVNEQLVKATVEDWIDIPPPLSMVCPLVMRNLVMVSVSVGPLSTMTTVLAPIPSSLHSAARSVHCKSTGMVMTQVPVKLAPVEVKIVSPTAALFKAVFRSEIATVDVPMQ